MTRRVLTSFIAAGVLGVFLAGQALAQAKVSLKPEAMVEGSEVYLSDIATIQSGEKSLTQSLSGIRVATVPMPGQTVNVDASSIQLRLRAAKIDPARVQVVDSSRTKVTRAFQLVDSGSLLEAARSAIEAAFTNGARIEVEATRSPADVRIRPGQVDLVARPSAARAGLQTVPVEIMVDGQKDRTVSVSLRVRVFQPVVVLTGAVARSQMITASDLTIDEREVTAFAADLIVDPFVAEGLKTRRAMAAGTFLRSADLEVIPLVRRNAPVVVSTTAGRVTIRSTGQALEDGTMGQMVRVRPAGSTETISGKVVAEGRVELAL